MSETSESPALTIDVINAMTREAFVEALGGVFEHSAWVAERAWAARPFSGVDGLHRAMVDVVRAATAEERLSLLRAHPDLGGRAGRAGALSASSAGEQSSAGLDRLAEGEYERFQQLNAAYRERFGFPFIIAVRRHDRASILTAFAQRLGHSREGEIDTALAEVFEIARLRLEAVA